jgi:hypothetical protein
MAKNGINFLYQYRKNSTAQQQLDKRLFKLAAVGFTVVILLTLTAISASFYFQLQIKATQDQTQQLEQSILDNQQAEKTAVLLGKKLSVLKVLFEVRHDKQQALRYFTTLFGDQVVVKDIDYVAEESILSLRVEADSIFETERVFRLFTNQQTKQLYPFVTSSELRRGDDGAYQVTLTVSLADTEDLL